eukprot:1836096-Prymnesium_polylepis.1
MSGERSPYQRSPYQSTTRPTGGRRVSACGALVWGSGALVRGSAAFRSFSRGGGRPRLFRGFLWLFYSSVEVPPPKRVSSSTAAGIYSKQRARPTYGQHMANTANMARAAATAMQNACARPPAPRTRPCTKRT